MDIVSYILAKKYTDKSILGISGVLSGKNCTIQSINKVDGLTTVTFKWTADDGTVRTSSMQVKDGETPTITVTPTATGNVVRFVTNDPAQDYSVNIKDGISITNAEVDANNHLKITLSDGTVIDAGEITTVSELSGLDDVALTTLSDGDSLVYDATSGKWINKELSYEYSVEDLTDVDIDTSTLADGDIIKWDATNSKWVKGQIPTIESLDDIGDVTLTALANGQIIKYDAVLGKWVNEDNEVVADLDDLQDVVIDTATLENGQILKYDSVRNVWYNGSASAVSTKVEDLEDVSINSIEDGQVLIWDATNEVWINGSSGSIINKLSDIEDVQVANLHDGDMIKYDAINKVWYNIGFDNAPTQNSDKMLDSNAVYQSELAIKNKLGDLTQLDTTVKTDLVGAVNELKSQEGDLSNLTTDDKFTLVGAIDEVDSHADANKANIGTLANLATVNKSDLVNAINELDGNIKGLKYAKQVTTLGNAEDSPNAIVEYIGANSGDLVKGYFYYSAPSVEQGQVIYTWEQINVQPRDNDYENLNNLPQINSVQLVGNKSLTDLGVQRIMQYSTMPTPSAEWTGGICIQYIGRATADLTPNYFYVCKYITEDAEYKWVNVDVSNNSALATRVSTLETNQGDMSQLTIASVSDLVSAINILAVRGIKSITYSEPYLTITLMDNSTFQFDITVILNSTDLGDLGNVLDSTIQNGNLLQYDASVLKYKPYDIVSALVNTLNSSKDYTDQEILKVNTASAIVVDAKPTYDASTNTVVYYQGGQVHVSDKPETRFYYTDSVSGDSFCVSWIDGTEFQYNVASVDYDDFVSKSSDVVSTYTTDMVDKDKIPNISAMDALYAIITTALALKVNTSDIVNSLLSDDATVPLSAAQGKVLNLKFDDKQNTIQYTTMIPVTAQMVTDNVVAQYIGADSQAYLKGRWYEASYNSEQDIYYWKEIKYSPDMVEITAAEVDSLWA